MKLLQGLTLVFFCWLLSACSTAFLYNQLDWLIPWYLGDYVNLTRPQKQSFKQQLLPILEWHRGEELQSYVVIVDGITTDLDGPISELTIRSWAEQLMAAYERLEERGLPLAFDLGEQLSDEQIQTFLNELREEQVELEEEYLGRSEQEFIDYSYENLQENLRDQLGRLSTEQEQVLRDAAAEMTRFDQTWLAERALWLDQMEDYLRREPGWQQRLREALGRRDEERSEEYRAAYVHNETVIYRAIAGVLNLRSDKQDRRLRKELADIRKVLDKLIAQGQAS